MKKVLSALLCFAFCLSIGLLSVKVYLEYRKIDPPGPLTRELGNAWTTIWESGRRSDPALTVTNHRSTAPVRVRFVDLEQRVIIAEEQTILPGCSADFSSLPTHGYFVQARSSDDLPREYTLLLEKSAAHPRSTVQGQSPSVSEKIQK